MQHLGMDSDPAAARETSAREREKRPRASAKNVRNCSAREEEGVSSGWIEFPETIRAIGSLTASLLRSTSGGVPCAKPAGPRS